MSENKKVISVTPRQGNASKYFMWGCISVLAISLVGFGGSIWYASSQENTLNGELRTMVEKGQVQDKKLTAAKKSFEKADNTANKMLYVVDSKGNPDTGNDAIVGTITNVFKKVTTYSSGSEYEGNRKDVMNMVSDEKFFDEYYASSLDIDGKSSIDVASQTPVSSFEGVRVYKVSDDKFNAVVTYNSGVKGNTLEPKTMMFNVTVSGDKLTKVVAQKGFVALNY